jgi:hypothetical protein
LPQGAWFFGGSDRISSGPSGPDPGKTIGTGKDLIDRNPLVHLHDFASQPVFTGEQIYIIFRADACSKST